MKRIHLISGPRNLSTALMYSFAHRSDTRVVDEPLYAHYLRVTGKEHPGRKEVVESMDSDWNRILQEVIFADYEHPVLFIKNMAHHLTEKDMDFLGKLDNVFLIRHPRQIISSFSQVIRYPDMSDIGIIRQAELLLMLQRKGRQPIVLDSGELLKNPPRVLEGLCNALQIPFEEGMLTWPPGPIPEDGIWAKYWYKNVHQSTGFKKQREKKRQVPDHLMPLYEQALPYYEELYKLSLKA